MVRASPRLFRAFPGFDSVTFAMPSLRVHRASDEFARYLAARIGRRLLLGLGSVLILLGLAIEFLPLPLHMPGMAIIVIGLMLVLRNSFKARRHFVVMQHTHPRMVFPLRRLLRREPEIVQVFWQQSLRVERLVLPRRVRFAVKGRRYLKRRLQGNAA
jgi:hypothetical protein